MTTREEFETRYIEETGITRAEYDTKYFTRLVNVKCDGTVRQEWFVVDRNYISDFEEWTNEFI